MTAAAPTDRIARAVDAHTLAHQRYLRHLRSCQNDYRCPECHKLDLDATAAGYWLDTLRAREAARS